MATLYAFGFEGGVVPTGVTPTGSMRPIIGRRVSDNLNTWGLSSSFTAVGQASVALDTSTSNTKIGGSFFFRADNLDFTTPDAIVTFGGVSFKLTSSTNLRLSHGSDVDLAITALTTGWHVLQFNIDLTATTDAISYSFDGGTLQQITLGGAVGGTANTLTIKSTKGYPSVIDDIRVETAIANGSVPAPIECRKSSMQAAFRNQWSTSGAPTGASSGLNIRGVTYAASTNLFYAIDSAGVLYSMDPETLTPTSVTTLNAAYGHCAIAYHQALNRLYFVGNGNVAYWSLTSNTLTEDAQTVYYAYNTHASGAYYEPSTGNAYIATQKNATSTDSVAVHKINISGTYSSTVSTGTYTPAAPMTRHFNVVFDKTTDEILFPMFASSVIGRCTQALSFTVSNTDGATNVSDIVDAGQYWAGTGTFMVASTDATSRLRTYSAGLIARYQTSAITNAGITGKGMVYHPALGLILYPITGAVGDLYKVDKSNTTAYLQSTAALPANASVYLLNQVNPVTGGLMYVYNNSLSEAHLLTNLNVSSLLVKDSKYIQSTVNNSEILLLPSAIANASQAMLKQNVMSKSMFGAGSISLNGVANNTSQTPANYSQAIDPLPLPEVLYDCDGATVIGDVVNLGSGSSTHNATGIALMTVGALAGKKCLSGSTISIINPASAVGTGDFTLCVYGKFNTASSFGTYGNYDFNVGSTDLWLSGKDTASMKVYFKNILITTIGFASSVYFIKLARNGGVFTITLDGAIVYSGTHTDSLSMPSFDLESSQTAFRFLEQLHSLAFWGTTYISEPNPIASLNRREVRVIKSS